MARSSQPGPRAGRRESSGRGEAPVARIPSIWGGPPLLDVRNAPMYWLLGAIYFVLIVTLGVWCLRRGHWLMFVFGIFFPLFWIIGSVMPPRPQHQPA